MITIHKKIGTILFALAAIMPPVLYAGNKDRVGQAGAYELRLNPWAASTGMGSANTASVVGLEAVHLNVSGLAFLKKTEVLFAHTNLFTGSDISINAFGLGQRVGESTTIGISVMNMSFGDIDITKVDQPEGGIGKFSPQFLNVGLSFAREFSNSIFGGTTIKYISEGISNANAGGIALDLGIRYVTGKMKEMKFGITLRNVGPKMQFKGDGLSIKTSLQGKEFTLEQRTEGFELPTLLDMGLAYDIYLGVKRDTIGKFTAADHKITVAGNFTSNSFGKDQLKAGVEYSFRSMFVLRGGYVFEEGITNSKDRSTFYIGPTAGGSLYFPFGKSGSIIGVDYGYQFTRPFSGTHTYGVRITL